MFINFLWYAITSLIYFAISFVFEIKRKNKKPVITSRRKKKGEKEKKLDMRPPGIEPEPTDSDSDMLTTLPSMHMALTRDQACIFLKCDTDKNKNNKKKKDAAPNLNSAHSARVIKRNHVVSNWFP